MLVIDEFGDDSEIQFKRLNRHDQDLFIHMIHNFRQETITPEKAEEFLSTATNVLLAAICKRKIVGFVLGYILQRYDNKGNMMYIHEVSVLDDYRCQGIGLALMERARTFQIEENLSKSFLITNKSNKRAVSLYEKSQGKGYATDDILYIFSPEDL